MMFTLLEDAAAPKPINTSAWAQPERDIPLHIREHPDGNVEGIHICMDDDGTYGIAHGILRLTGDACSAYRRMIATEAFKREEYWKTCLLPERHADYGRAEKKLRYLMEQEHGV